MSQNQLVPIGVEDYKEIIDNKNAYVDKTLLIKEFWQDGGKVILVPRPRRFGKTLNLSMLKYFFEKTNQNNTNLFENTNIWAFAEYRDLQGKYPVIFLTFKDIKSSSWELAYEEFAIIISEECKRLLSNAAIENFDPSDFAIFNRLKEKQASEGELIQSLQFLSRLLYEQIGKKVIVLIDEYDAPIIQSYLHNYYEKMVEFVNGLLSKVLKTNSALEKGFLTGITRIAKEGIFSGLNHLSVYTILNTQYSDKFGFTQEEVDQLLINYDLYDKKDEIKDWYDGYIFGNTNIYNPWSLLSCISFRGDLQTYWANTSNNNLIKNLIAKSGQAIKDDIELLLQGKEIVNKEIDEGISLRDLKNNIQSIQGFWSIFLFTGYLTATSRVFKNKRYYYTLALPNTEIELLYEKLIAEAMNQTLVSDDVTELFTALITGNQNKLTVLLQKFVINSCSFFDLPIDDIERSIHLFVLGLLTGLSDRYIIKSNRSPHLSAGTPNRESGFGRYDIMLAPRTSQDPGILIEFKKAKIESKKSKNNEKILTKSAKEALEQIKSLSYKAEIKDFGYQGPVLCYGIAVFGKELVVAMEII